MNKIYPFKFLDAYSKDDTEIFFGRNEEIEILYDMVYQSSILLLYGVSGTGKTSLIQCGLAQKFQTHDWLPVYIRRGSNLNVSLEKALENLRAIDSDMDLDWLDEIGEDVDSKTVKTELTPIQLTVQQIYQNHFKPIYLVFDQFEELYILGDNAEQKQFIETVKDILSVEQPVKLIFSIREEYLGYLYEFEKAVPQLLRKKLRVEPMNIDKVRQVMMGITSYEFSNIFIKKGEETAVTDAIFDKLKNKKELTIQLPYLQVFLDKLYLSVSNDQDRKADAEFTIKALDAIGDIGDVLSDFLEEQVKAVSLRLQKEYEGADSKAIWEILSPFATLEGTKDPISKSQLYERLPKTQQALINEVLELFVTRRILRYSETDNLYEIAHDSLAQRIAEKRSDDEIALLEVRRLIKSQNLMKAEARELFSEKQLLFIEPFIEKIKLNKQEKTLIEESRKDVEYKKSEKLRRQRKITLIVGIAAVVSIAFGIFGWVNMRKAQNEQARTKELTITGNLRDAYAYVEREEYQVAYKKYILLRDTILEGNTTPAIEKRIKKCMKLDSISKLFYNDLDAVDSLLKSDKIEDLQKIGGLLTQLDSLKYKPGKIRLQNRSNTYNLKIENVIKEKLRIAESMISADLREDAIRYIKGIEQLDPENMQIKAFKEGHNIL